jgi:crotonobetainyl-CoA:carnitine CoA-transferase CaiB-like acyl-CoA transferase
LDREVTGKGQWVHTSLLESQIALMDFQAASWLIEQKVPQQAGNNHPKSTPTGVFPTKDGHINIAAGGQQMWTRLCMGLGAEALLENTDYKTGESRLANRDRLNGDLSVYTATRTSAEWVDLLNNGGVPCGPIYTLDQTFADPQVRHLGIAKSVPHPTRGEIKVVGQPFQMSRSTTEMRSGTPGLGEHTDAVLAGIGYDEAAIAGLRKRGVI